MCFPPRSVTSIASYWASRAQSFSASSSAPGNVSVGSRTMSSLRGASGVGETRQYLAGDTEFGQQEVVAVESQLPGDMEQLVIEAQQQIGAGDTRQQMSYCF